MLILLYLSPRKQILTAAENKKQLTQIMVGTLIIILCGGIVPGNYQSRLIIYTLSEIAPGGIVIRRADLKTTHEKADIISVAQAINAAKDGKKN